MAFEVARAYDENKNLVPLYILTDGEVPEVSPGFDVTSQGGSTFIVTSYSSNPTGGSFKDVYKRENASMGINITNITVQNNSNFTIRVIVDYGGNVSEFSLSPCSSQNKSVNYTKYNYSVDVSVARLS